MKRILLGLVIIVLSIASLFIGVRGITLQDLIQGDTTSLQVLFLARVPRLLAVLITGVAMAIGGTIMQQLVRNKYASPQTGATINSAQLGVIIAMIFIKEVSMFEKTLLAFLFAIMGTGLFVWLVQKIQFKDVIFVPLVGMMFGGVISSITQFIAYKHDMVQNASDWLQGDFSLIVKGNYEILYLCFPFVIIAFLYANHFNIVGLGDDFAKNLGINSQRILYMGLGIVCVLTASVVVTVGTVPFIGLIVPNIVSIYRGDRLKGTLMDTAMFGMLFLLLCDILGRLIIFPYEIPIGLTVGVIGSGVFLLLMHKGRRRA